MSGVIKGDKESKVGKKLSDHITKKVVILVLSIIFASPIFTVVNYVEVPNSYNYGLDLLLLLGPRTEAGSKVFQEIIERQGALETPLIELYVDLNDGKGIIQWKDKNVDFKHLRKTEKEVSELHHNVPKG